MLLSIIFSYNRAMQLDYLLQSILDKFKVSDYEIAVIYHTTGEHSKGYQLLIENYKKYNFIKFYERKEGFDKGILPALNCRTHLRFFNKYHFKNKNRDNFKGLLENILKTTKHEFVMFNTDDGVFYRDFEIKEDVQSMMRNNPTVASYRTYVGENLEDVPNYVQKWGKEYLWDYNFEKKTTHWSFPFAVDGTVYHTKGLLSILRNIAYHNPVTLEENAVIYIKRNKLFGIGISPTTSCLVCTKLNRVSVDSSNPTIHIKPDFLNEKYINGYRLELVLQDNISNANLVPDKVILVKNDSRETIYEIDDFGKLVQNNLGVEGAKIQMD